MRPALVLIDLQNDFLDRAGLVPGRADVVAGASGLLRACRQARIPVMHVMTLVRKDGSNRMPHWVENNVWMCVDGTEGASPPRELMPSSAEPVFPKTCYSAFDNPDVFPALVRAGVDTVIIAGVYTHACVRTTALDAYSRGFAVRIARDAVASIEPLHAEITLAYLEKRSIPGITSDEITLAANGGEASSPSPRFRELRNPARWSDLLEEVTLSTPRDVDAAVERIKGKAAAWARTPFHRRAECLAGWEWRIRSRRAEFVSLMVRDIGKPVTYAEGEFEYALKLLAHTIGTLAAQSSEGDGFVVRHAPTGVVGLITPWNNPLAIPVGKIAPALAWGNSAVWKPALPATRVARLLADTLLEAVPEAPIGMLPGDEATGRCLVGHGAIDAISFTGSTAQGRAVSALCALHGKRLQAELGGNNAALVMADADPELVARRLAPALFGFAGQRCTAPRRVIVEKPLRAVFERHLLREIAALPVGDPSDPSVQVGPLVSMERQADMLNIVKAAEGRILCGGRIPAGFEHGAWMEPTLIADPPPAASVVMEESFGPIAVLMTADDSDHALALCNSVPHGLVTTLFTTDPELQRNIIDGAESGIVVINAAPAPIDPAAPFSGWKASGMGPPEHGRWDREFYARPKAVYGGANG